MIVRNVACYYPKTSPGPVRSWLPRIRLSLAVCLVVFAGGVRAEVDGDAIKLLQSAGSGADLDQSASALAWKSLGSANIDDLPTLLMAYDDATPMGINWLSSAIDRVLQNQPIGTPVPTKMLSNYVLNTEHGARGRQMALELLRDQSEEVADQVISRLTEDPSAVMRYPAIERQLKQVADEPNDEAKLAAYKEIFKLALDERHVVKSVVALRELGHTVDHIRKFGLLMHWQVVGPFDYADGDGFDTVYPPEKLTLEDYNGPNGIYSDVKYEGKTEGEPVGWKKYVNTARNGSVDLNKAVDQIRDAVAYGAAVFESDREQQVQLRLRQQNSAKLWLNGKLVFNQPVGHTGNFFDQYTVPVTLKKGPNLILVKSCQFAGPVYHPFVNTWQLSVRVTDETGNAILAVNRPPTPELDPLPSQGNAATKDDDSGDAKDSKDETKKESQ